ncbi:hypothetical protein BJ138DRAFT_1018099, partial [Hygrophoropsis aurantiaca]
PTWLTEATDYLHMQDNSDEWTELVEKLVELDRRLGYPKGLSCVLSSVSRPTDISNWIKSGRDYNKCPTIHDTGAFGDSLLEWWEHLQPDWCRNPDGSLSTDLPPQSEIVWNELAKGSVNGFLMTVMIGLAWCIRKTRLAI